MGRHFDGLVDLIKKEIQQADQSNGLIDINTHLRRIVDKFALFEFPLRKDEIRPKSGKDSAEYHRYLQDYMALSQQFGKFMGTPFEKMGIEDPDSVVFMEQFPGCRFNEYRVTNFYVSHGESRQMLQVADVDVTDTPEISCFKFDVRPIYQASIFPWHIDEIILQDDAVYLSVAEDITNAALAFIQENVYIEDPLNFIIEKESNASRAESKKRDLKPHKERKPRKTIMRPHYIIRSEEDTTSFFRSESKDKEPVMIHTVRGHWKTLISEKYKKCKGKKIEIAQYYRGQGEIEGRNGLNYRVLLKENLVVLPYRRSE